MKKGKATMSMLKLARLAMRRLQSTDDYRAMQTYIARSSVVELEGRGVDLGSSRILELGAGNGGYSLILNERAKEFLASDLFESAFFGASGIPFKTVDVLKPFPFSDAEFDLVYSSSLIEHLNDPTNMIREAFRVLRPGGIFFLSYPPFYSLTLVGGHHFKPFHLLGEGLAVKIWNLKRKKRGKPPIQDYGTCYGGFGLHPLKIDQVSRMLTENGFLLVEIGRE